MLSEQSSEPPAASEIETPSTNPDWLPRWELIALVTGDMFVLILFVLLGRASHSVQAGQGALMAFVNTAAPFILAWVLVGTVVGMYSGRALYPLGRVIWRTALADLIAAPLGVVMRAVWLARPVAASFVVVAMLVTLVMMLIWRVGWSRLRRLWWPELP
jgi:FlaA1/EpsC-like NDP-sugar epimerase